MITESSGIFWAYYDSPNDPRYPKVTSQLRFIALINQMRIGIRAEVAVQLFMLFDDDQNGYLDRNTCIAMSDADYPQGSTGIRDSTSKFVLWWFPSCKVT